MKEMKKSLKPVMSLTRPSRTNENVFVRPWMLLTCQLLHWPQHPQQQMWLLSARQLSRGSTLDLLLFRGSTLLQLHETFLNRGSVLLLTSRINFRGSNSLHLCLLPCLIPPQLVLLPHPHLPTNDPSFPNEVSFLCWHPLLLHRGRSRPVLLHSSLVALPVSERHPIAMDLMDHKALDTMEVPMIPIPPLIPLLLLQHHYSFHLHS
jgi:hypothetical protein